MSNVTITILDDNLVHTDGKPVDKEYADSHLEEVRAAFQARQSSSKIVFLKGGKYYWEGDKLVEVAE